nr:MAG TPA: hypothetical protein [Caudoviricetes sp.]
MDKFILFTYSYIFLYFLIRCHLKPFTANI